MARSGLTRREAPDLAPRGRDDRAIARLRAHAEPLPEIDSAAFGALFDRYGDARVVLIGEATHGTSDFYRARAEITRRLIERHGFSIVAIEADWPDAAAIDRYVRQRPAPLPLEAAFTRFPMWMWRNEEVAEFVAWLQSWNAARAPELRVELRGLDVYSLRTSIDAVLRYLDSVDTEAAKAARERYSCLTPWQADPALYGRAVLLGEDPCENEVIGQLKALLQRRLDAAAGDGEALFDAERNARVVRAAEQYYRLMYRSSAESWNLRDRHMFETLQALLERRGPGAKAVVWAHNSHVGNADATAPGWSGEINIGALSRRAWGRDAVLIGQGTDRGTVAAAHDWDGPVEIMTVLPSRPDSWEQAFLHAGVDASLTDWRDPARAALRLALSEPRLERAIGVVYRPQSERMSHYFEAVLAEQFDAWLWFAETRAVQPLGEEVGEGIPETYPFGL